MKLKLSKLIEKKKTSHYQFKEIARFSSKKIPSSTHKMGDIVKGAVKDSKDFGIFIKLEDNLDGLIRNEDFGPLEDEEVKMVMKLKL